MKNKEIKAKKVILDTVESLKKIIADIQEENLKLKNKILKLENKVLKAEQKVLILQKKINESGPPKDLSERLRRALERKKAMGTNLHTSIDKL